MRLTCRNRRSHDDQLFDMPVNEQRFYVSRCLDLDPGNPLYWPMAMIDHLIGLRKHEGPEAFYREIGALLSHS